MGKARKSVEDTKRRAGWEKSFLPFFRLRASSIPGVRQSRSLEQASSRVAHGTSKQRGMLRGDYMPRLQVLNGS